MFGRLFLLAFLLMAFGMPLAAADGFTIPNSLSMAIASGLCALAQGKAVYGAAEGMARNPGATAGIRFIALLGLILIESLALYTLVIIFAKA
jgi:F-type H+-transporting ATPase subunit c